MRKVGIAELPLHYGKAPYWLLVRMRKLAEQIIRLIIDEYGQEELLRRLANPFWFQALCCVLGYDWHSSGTTTVTTAVLKTISKPEELGFAVAGGKGKHSTQAPREIEKISEEFNLSTRKTESLVRASKLSAKVDNTAIQAGYPLYHHAFFLTEKGKWVVIQQGLSVQDQTARRYHWLSEHVKSFVEEPHDAVCCDLVKPNVLDMTSKESKETRKISVDLAKEGVRRIKNDLLSLRPMYQKSLHEYLPTKQKGVVAHILKMPRNINWEALRKAYDFQPKNYEELIGIKGIGPSTVRGLALISEVIYGKSASWKDPCKFAFCVGGKDGVPYPVNRKTYDEIITTLEDAIQGSELNKKDKANAIKRLSSFAKSLQPR